MRAFGAVVQAVRIGMLTTSYPHANDPVAGSFVRGMACALAARGHSLDVVCAGRQGDDPVRDHGVRVHSAHPVSQRSRALFYTGGAPEALATRGAGAWVSAADWSIALARVARRKLDGCDALVSHFAVPCGAVAGLMRHGRRHLGVVHGSDAWWLARAPAVAQRAVLAGCDAVQFAHAGLRSLLDPRAVTGKRVIVAPMGYDAITDREGRRRATREGLGVADDAVLVLAIARLVPLKGIDLLVRSATVPGVQVCVAGDGPEREALETLARTTGAAVRFLGAVEPQRRDDLLCAADVFVAPSREVGGRPESAPAAVVEAMGAGVCVIASACGGLPALLGDAGVLVPADDVRALRDAITWLAREPSARAEYGRRAVERARPWAWSVQAEAIERVLGA